MNELYSNEKITQIGNNNWIFAKRITGRLFHILLKGYIVPFWIDTIKLINIYGIAEEVSYLHSKNVIHGDLKPRNVIFNSNLIPKLSDFGSSTINYFQKTKPHNFVSKLNILLNKLTKLNYIEKSY